MRDLSRFEALSDGLERACREHDGLVGLVLLGSAADASRRDEWSDHDFFALVRPGEELSVRPRLDWLPEQERIVLTAREGEIGFAAVYDDGHVFEFAVATAAELSGAVANDAAIVYDEGGAVELIEAARERAAAAAAVGGTGTAAANDARLVLVKLLIGVGRARRGETLVAGQFVRTWAVNHFVRAVRARVAPEASARRDDIDPLRRFEQAYPGLAPRIAAALERPVEEGARELHVLLRETLEPGWTDFPSRAADVVAHRLGWLDRLGWR